MTTTEDLISMFLACADRLETELAAYARKDDPNGFHRLHKQFDDGKAIVSLVSEHSAPEKRRLSLRLTGLRDGEPVTIAVSDYVVKAVG